MSESYMGVGRIRMLATVFATDGVVAWRQLAVLSHPCSSDASFRLRIHLLSCLYFGNPESTSHCTRRMAMAMAAWLGEARRCSACCSGALAAPWAAREPRLGQPTLVQIKRKTHDSVINVLSAIQCYTSSDVPCRPPQPSPSPIPELLFEWWQLAESWVLDIWEYIPMLFVIVASWPYKVPNFMW